MDKESKQITWKEIKEFSNSLTDEQLAEDAYVLVSDDSQGTPIRCAELSEFDIYSNKKDPEDCGRLEDLKELHGDEFVLEDYILSTPKDTPFIWAE